MIKNINVYAILGEWPVSHELISLNPYILMKFLGTVFFYKIARLYVIKIGGTEPHLAVTTGAVVVDSSIEVVVVVEVVAV